MQSLKLPHLITVERVTRAKSASGNDEETWAPVPGFTRIPGEVLPGRASEFFAARQVQATATAEIKLWYQPGILPTDRVVHHVRPGIDEYWDVAGVVPFQYNQRELRLMCTWRDTEGYRRGVDLEG